MSEESKSWYLMNRPLFNSGFEDDEFAKFGQDGFREILESFIAKDVRIYQKTIQENPSEIRAIIQNLTSDVQNSSFNRQILCEIGVLHCGQYVEYDGSFWLVATLPDNNQVYEKAILWKCKHSVRFVSPLTGELTEYPVYSINSTQYGTGEKGKQHITVGDAQHLIYIPYNEETVLIDDQFRFLIDRNKVHPTAFRVTQVDTMSYAVGDEFEDDGLLQWTVTETQFNAETDDINLMTADINIERKEASVGTENAGDVIYLHDEDEDGDITVGESKKIYVDLGGRILLDQAPTFTASLSCDDDCATIEQTDYKTVVIRAANNDSNIGKRFTLTVSSGNANARMSLRIVGW